jgi:hypothetical protein
MHALLDPMGLDSMAPQPRWTVPINMRSQDKPILDAALRIAKNEGSDITTVFRTALSEFVRTRTLPEGEKMDKFLDNSEMSDPIYNRILTPGELKKWTDSDLLSVSKRVKARREELDFELRRRGYFFKW